MKYRKKPVVIDAIQWNGKNTDEILRFCEGGEATYESMVSGVNLIVIETLESEDEVKTRHAASVNDWIIRGVKGEYYPCKPDIFEMTYEDVKEHTADNCYKKFYNHIRSELDLAPMRNHDRLDVICKLCGKSFKQITGVAEQSLEGE